MSKLIRMKCQDCGHGLEYNRAERIVFCPYCGSKNLLEESDEVKIADRQYTSMERMQENKLSHEDKKHRRAWYLVMAAVLILVIWFVVMTTLIGIKQGTI